MATPAGRGQSVEAELRLAIHSLFRTIIDMAVASHRLLHEMASSPGPRRPPVVPLLPVGHRVASALERAATAGILRSRHVTDMRVVVVGAVLLRALEEQGHVVFESDSVGGVDRIRTRKESVR